MALTCLILKMMMMMMMMSTLRSPESLTHVSIVVLNDFGIRGKGVSSTAAAAAAPPAAATTTSAQLPYWVLVFLAWCCRMMHWKSQPRYYQDPKSYVPYSIRGEAKQAMHQLFAWCTERCPAFRGGAYALARPRLWGESNALGVSASSPRQCRLMGTMVSVCLLVRLLFAWEGNRYCLSTSTHEAQWHKIFSMVPQAVRQGPQANMSALLIAGSMRMMLRVAESSRAAWPSL